MVDRLRPGCFDDLAKAIGIRQVDLDEIQPVDDVLQALEVAAAMQDVKLGFVSRQELADDLRPDEARTACDQNRHGSSVSDATRRCLASEGLPAPGAQRSRRLQPAGTGRGLPLRDAGRTRYGRLHTRESGVQTRGYATPGERPPHGLRPGVEDVGLEPRLASREPPRQRAGAAPGGRPGGRLRGLRRQGLSRRADDGDRGGGGAVARLALLDVHGKGGALPAGHLQRGGGGARRGAREGGSPRRSGPAAPVRDRLPLRLLRAEPGPAAHLRARHTGAALQGPARHGRLRGGDLPWPSPSG